MVRVLTAPRVEQFQVAQVSRYPVGLTCMQEGEKKSHKVIPFEEKKNAILLACHDKASEIPIIQVTLLIGAPC